MSPTEIEQARDSMGLPSIESVLSETEPLPDEHVAKGKTVTQIIQKVTRVLAYGLLAILVGLFAILVISTMFPTILASCHCELGGGCRGCGGPVGNAIGSFLLTGFAFGAMGFVLLIWFGIPAAILGLIVYGFFKFFSKKADNQ